jgi:hypothetical protein
MKRNPFLYSGAIFILLFTLLNPEVVGEERQLSQAEVARLKRLSQEIIKEGFPALDNDINGRKRKFRLRFYTIKKAAYFMESNFSWKRVLFGTPDYRIGVNPIIFDKGIPADALKGVLAHELTHSEHYYRGTTLRTLLPIGVKVLGRNSRAKYERKTDKEVVLKGFGEQLKAYRLWQYSLLSPEDLAVKKREYLTPEEIDEIMMNMDKANI